MQNTKNMQRKFYLYEKAKCKDSIRVLYKQTGKNPRVRIIPNVQILKRAIINNECNIIPYQNVFLICNNQAYMKTTPINVVFDFFHISGDLIVVQIDKKTREFKSLSQEDIIWYTNDLNYRSYNPSTFNMCTSNINSCNYSRYSKNNYFKEINNIVTNEQQNFETSLVQALNNIELTLASLLATNTKKGGK